MGLDFADAVATLQKRFGPVERSRLQRILARAVADCDGPAALASIGTGAQTTRKRALAVRMALDGSSLEAIAQAASLTPERSLQVLSRVADSGFAALYPSFAEDCQEAGHPENWWAMLQPILSRFPGELGYLAPVWTPASLLDCLIHQGKLEDGSVTGIEATIRSSMSPDEKRNTFDYTEGDIVPERRPTAYGPYAGIAIGLILAAVANLYVPLVLYPFAGSILLISVLAVYRGLKEKQLLRAVVTHAPEPAPRIAPQPSVNAIEPTVVIRHASTLPAVSPLVNPVPVLYLWVFQAYTSQFVYETQGWPQAGPVHLLLNSSALPAGMLRRAKASMLVQDQAALKAAVDGYQDCEGIYPRPNLFLTSGGMRKSKYRGYPIHTLLCTDAVWQDAFHRLANRCHLAIFNLTGYKPGHPGLEYELRHVLAGGPPRHFVFMYDRQTDADGAIDSVLAVWNRLPDCHGPATLIFLRYQDAQSAGYALQFEKPPLGFGSYVRFRKQREGEYRPIAGAVIELVESLQPAEV